MASVPVLELHGQNKSGDENQTHPERLTCSENDFCRNAGRQSETELIRCAMQPWIGFVTHPCYSVHKI